MSETTSKSVMDESPPQANISLGQNDVNEKPRKAYLSRKRRQAVRRRTESAGLKEMQQKLNRVTSGADTSKVAKASQNYVDKGKATIQGRVEKHNKPKKIHLGRKRRMALRRKETAAKLDAAQAQLAVTTLSEEP